MLCATPFHIGWIIYIQTRCWHLDPIAKKELIFSKNVEDRRNSPLEIQWIELEKEWTLSSVILFYTRGNLKKLKKKNSFLKLNHSQAVLWIGRYLGQL